MLNRWLPAAAFFLTAVLMFGAGCGTNSALPGSPQGGLPTGGQTSPPTVPPTMPATVPPTVPPTMPPTIPPTIPPACSGQNSVAVANQTQGETIALPAVCGFTGSVAIPSSNYARRLGVDLFVPVSNTGPSAPTGTTTGILSVIASTDGNLGGGNFDPGFQMVVTLPPAIPTSGKSFVMAACSYTTYFLGAPPNCSGTVLVNASVNGQTLTFNDPAGFNIRIFIGCVSFNPRHHCPPNSNGATSFVANIYY